MNVRQNNSERWIWIELIGFDNTQPDCGAAEYLDKLGFVPDVISYLITAPDIVHHHNGLDDEIEFPADYCSYCGHPRNSERERQVWTNHQLRTLNRALQARGIKVYLATFLFYLENFHHLEWVRDYPELLETHRNGKQINSLMPLKRFKDGSYYEDFFIPQLVRTLQDYGFDGWHAADGWGPARGPLSYAEYSDDMFQQFVEAEHVDVPPHIQFNCGDSEAAHETRADWIWTHKRREWLNFNTDRWAGFHRKQATAIHAIGKQIVINSAWTRDPFEAIYRHGIDYRKIIAAGVDGIVTESAFGASDMEAEAGFRHYDYTAALMLIRAYVPETKLVFLNGVKDVKEQWDLIRHAPTVYETEICALSNVFFQNAQSQLQRCADGFVICLGDGISKEEWRWLEKRWELAFSGMPERLVGATLVWSDRAFDNEIQGFVANRITTTHRLLHKLMEYGAPVHSVVRIEDIAQAQGPLLVLNGHLLPESEHLELLRYQKGPVVTIGRESETEMTCRVREGDVESVESTGVIRDTEPLAATQEPTTFLYGLPMQDVPADFMEDCAKAIARIAGSPVIVNGERQCKVQTMQSDANHLRMIIYNDQLHYSSPLIDVLQPIESIQVLSEFPCAHFEPEGSLFSIKVPGRGVVVVDMVLQNGGRVTTSFDGNAG